MQINIPYGQFLRAKAAADAPVFNNDFKRIAPPDRSDRAATMQSGSRHWPARCRHQEILEPETFAHQPSHAVVRIGARRHTGIAPRAFVEVQNQQALRLHQSCERKSSRENAATMLRRSRFASCRRAMFRGPRHIWEICLPSRGSPRRKCELLDVIERVQAAVRVPPPAIDLAKVIARDK